MGASRVRVLAAVSIVVAVAGCARFDDSATSPFTPAPTFDAGGELRPRPPGTPPTSPREPLPTVEPAPCIDPDPAVVATCLDTTGGMAMLPGGDSALVTERRTGRILRVTPGSPEEFARPRRRRLRRRRPARFALSPTFVEDNLVYAYVSTPATTGWYGSRRATPPRTS